MLKDLRTLFKHGHISPKIYMADSEFDANYYGYVKVIESARDSHALTLMHCEDSALLASAVDDLNNKHQDDMRH